ncbi:hypothetical protein [Microbacterium lacticum]
MAARSSDAWARSDARVASSVPARSYSAAGAIRGTDHSRVVDAHADAAP